MTAHPGVILRRPHSRQRLSNDPDALPYRGWYDHKPRTGFDDTVVLDELGRRNGLTHTWLRWVCWHPGCGYVLLVREDYAEKLALAIATPVRRFTSTGVIGTALTTARPGEPLTITFNPTGTENAG